MKRRLLTSAAGLAGALTFWTGSSFSHEVVNTTVTYDREIVRILSRKCVSCHSEKNIGMPLTNYEQTRPWSRAIEDEVLQRHMPPWRAVEGYGEFINDIGLTNTERQFVVSWVEGNGPRRKDEGFIGYIGESTVPDKLLSPDFTKWQLGKPDLLKSLHSSSIAAGQKGDLRRVTLDLGLKSDRWIRALEFQPGDHRVVRAVFFSLQETGQWLGSWTPWYGVTKLPPETAFFVPAGSHIVAEIFYRGADQVVEDSGTLGVYFAPAQAPNKPMDLVVETKRNTNSNEPIQRFSGSVKLQADADVLALRPELPSGTDTFELSATRPDGTIEVLLLVRRALADWPTPYILRTPLPLPKNTELTLTGSTGESQSKQPFWGLKLIVSLVPRGIAAGR